MDKLDEKNAEAFGQTVSGIVKGMPDTNYLDIGMLIENIYSTPYNLNITNNSN